MVQRPDRLARSPSGESTRTNQRRICRTSPVSGPRRTPRWWRLSAGGCRTAAHGQGAFQGRLRGSAVSSRCPLIGLAKGQAAQIVSSLGGVAAGRKDCPLVSLQKLNPVGDIARIPDVTVKAKFGTQEGGA